jgi:AraC-like DNA-binding protein
LRTGTVNQRIDTVFISTEEKSLRQFFIIVTVRKAGQMHINPYDIECLQKAKDLVDADLVRHYTIPEITRHAGISATKLKSGFRQLFGMGLYQYHKEQRLLKAADLLENSNKTLKQISYSLGYKHTCNFLTAFKKRYGMPPGQWKNSLL